MANFHMEISVISRGKGRSITRTASYISGRTLYDIYDHRRCYNSRKDISFCEVFVPRNAPPNFRDLQSLCNEIDKAERRYDARTAREFIASLPNELPLEENITIVKEFIKTNFLDYGLGAVVAIHEGRNETDPAKNNPHVHILVTTRVIDPEGFSKWKDREHDSRKYITIWSERWARIQNRAYARNQLSTRVSHESLEVQGIRDREPTIHLSPMDMQKEKRGERTRAGDRKREIEARNKKREKKSRSHEGHSR